MVYKQSSTKPVLSRVPQLGISIIGRTLTLSNLYISDSASEPLDRNTRITLYADDMLLYNVDSLSNWVVKNNLTLNTILKCKFMVISNMTPKELMQCPPAKTVSPSVGKTIILQILGCYHF